MRQSTVAESMRMFLDLIKADFPSWARWACVLPDDRLWLFAKKPTLTEFGAQTEKCVMQFGMADAFGGDWKQTLTELATIKPGLTVAPTVRNDRIVDNNEMVERDEREPTLKEKYVMWKADQAEIKPISKLLTIPSTLPNEQAMPMMLGDGFGGVV